MRKLQCPRCNFVMSLDNGANYMRDYEAISNHSKGHNPPVVGAWPEAPSPVPARYLSKPGYRCFHPECKNTFSVLSDIPCGWTVTAKMVENLATHGYTLSYLCRCPVHPEIVAYTPPLSNWSESIKKNHEHQDNPMKHFYPGDTPTAHDHSDRCLNPDAVAVKWFECALCGRTRSVTVSTDVW